MTSDDELGSLVDAFRPIGLEELERGGALLQRVDVKYVVEWPEFVAFCERTRDDHRLLEIDGRRSFQYETVYFDTPELRCYREHVSGVVPRFKARTRLYADSGRCVFEVKLKVGDDETDKRQFAYPPEERDRISPDAERFIAKNLAERDIDPPPRLEPSLRTAFQRLTLAAEGASDRLTCDLELELSRGDQRATLLPSLVVLESKSETGESKADTALRAAGAEPTSLSKYRAGIELLARPAGADRLDADRYFAVAST